jgi:integrase
MPSFRKRSKGWEAMVAKKGVRKSRTFPTKAQAMAWAVDVERDIAREEYSSIPDKTFAQLLQQYATKISITKKGCDWERKRINKICEDPLGQVPLPILKAGHFAEYRDRRLAVVTEATVAREWNLISHALNVAIKEWNWLAENPLKSLKRPKSPPPRERRFDADEIDRILYALGYEYNRPIKTITARVGAALLFAIETAMRAGEICSLTWQDIDLTQRTAKLLQTKNGFPRVVPLSSEAIRLIQQVKLGNDTNSVFNLKTSQIDSLFRKAKSRALIEDLHFHDSRAEAITRLSAKVDILTLARISGHRDLRMLQVYYRESMADVAKRL